MKHPYSDLPNEAFWKSAIATRHFLDLENVAPKINLGLGDAVATAGSCFAQHISRHLRAQGANVMDLEPAPAELDASVARENGYGLYSCRYGNVYTARQMLQLAQEAMGERKPVDLVWERGGRFFDGLRPSVDPVGHATAERILHLRRMHLSAVRKMLETMDVLVFTLGLTETWMHEDGTVYPTAPGTVAGEFDPNRYRFHNFRYDEVISDLQDFWAIVKRVNPGARLLLTVSPVPLTATASGQHVLVATTQSKATLRAVAGSFAEDNAEVSYFPSYEIIATHPSRAMFFNPDMRSVNDAGVEYVMSHFFKAIGAGQASALDDSVDPICDEEGLERYA